MPGIDCNHYFSAEPTITTSDNYQGSYVTADTGTGSVWEVSGASAIIKMQDMTKSYDINTLKIILTFYDWLG